ncbi:MAG: PadR family transcriptional regulator [Thermoplasmata archaeon]|nr:PadR family transcriptional regulator [Thermoplasmata archaeon]
MDDSAARWWFGGHKPGARHGGPGHGFGRHRGGLRTWVLMILARSPRTGAQLIDSMESISMGWWRPSPGSIYPLLEELTKEGVIRRQEADGKYELTDKGRETVNFPLGFVTGRPQSVAEVTREIRSYAGYLEDLARDYPEQLNEVRGEIREIAQRLEKIGK